MHGLLVAAALFAQGGSPVKVSVDSRFELLSVCLWLSGIWPGPADSDYKMDAFNHFRKYRDHEAIKALKAAEKKFTDISECAILIDEDGSLHVERNPAIAERWKKNMGEQSFNKFFASLPVFIKDTRFTDYYGKNRSRFRSYEKDFSKLVAQNDVIGKLDRFYRLDADRKFPSVEVYLEPLNNWGAHAIVHPDTEKGSLEHPIRFEIGNWTDGFLDEPVRFASMGRMGSIVWHEASHVILAPLFSQYAPQISKLSRLFNAQDRPMVRQNITTWEYCLNENVVRAVAAVLIKQSDGDAAYARELNDQTKGAGFIYVRSLAEWILNDFVSGTKYKNFDAYFPVLLEHLESLPDYKPVN